MKYPSYPCCTWSSFSPSHSPCLPLHPHPPLPCHPLCVASWWASLGHGMQKSLVMRVVVVQFLSEREELVGHTNRLAISVVVKKIVSIITIATTISIVIITTIIPMTIPNPQIRNLLGPLQLWLLPSSRKTWSQKEVLVVGKLGS